MLSSIAEAFTIKSTYNQRYSTDRILKQTVRGSKQIGSWKPKLQHILSCVESPQHYALYCLQNQVQANDETVYYPGKTSYLRDRLKKHARALSGTVKNYYIQKPIVRMGSKCDGKSFYASTYRIEVDEDKPTRFVFTLNVYAKSPYTIHGVYSLQMIISEYMGMNVGMKHVLSV